MDDDKNFGSLTRADKLAASLRDKILSGQLTSGTRLPSEREMTTIYGISRTTVRRAIALLAEEGLIEQAPGAGTFVRLKPSAQNLVRPDSLALIVPTLALPHYAELSEAIEVAARHHGFQLLIAQSQYSPAREAEILLQYAAQPMVKGILIVPNLNTVATATYAALNAQNVPFVFVGRWASGVDADGVAADHFQGGYEMTRYLISLGHERIAFVQGPSHPPNPRMQGYVAALRDAGIPQDPDLLFMLDTFDHETAGEEAVRQMLERGTRFTAIFGRNDLEAGGALRALHQTGMTVPDDVTLVGFDNSTISSHLHPKLTTLDLANREVGHQATTLLIDRIERRYAGRARRISIAPTLIVRESSTSPSTIEDS